LILYWLQEFCLPFWLHFSAGCCPCLGGYEENLLDWHRYTAIAVCIVSIALLAYKKYKKEEYRTPIYHAGFHLMMLALLLAGHFGGEMTHGEGYLFTAATDTETGCC